MVCWKKDRDPLKAWNNEMTVGGNKPHVWAPSLTTPSPYQSTEGKAVDTERPSRDDYKPKKDIDLPPALPSLRLPSRTKNFNLEPNCTSC
jgi:hypothetical protein